MSEPFETAVVIREQDDLIALVIATDQAIIRQGLDPETRLTTMIQGKTYRYAYSTVGMTQEQHDQRIEEGTANGDFA